MLRLTIWILFLTLTAFVALLLWSLDIQYHPHQDIAFHMTLSEPIALVIGGLVFIAMLALLQLSHTLRRHHQINEQLKLQTALREKAELENQRKSQVLAYVAHDIRNPLHAISSYSDLLLGDSVGLLSEKQHRFVENIQHSGEQILDLVSDILDIAAIEAGKIELSCERISLEPLLTGVSLVLEEVAKQKGVTLTMDLEPGIEIIQGDPRRLRQILMNIVSNAVKYTRDNTEVLCRVYTSGDQDYVYFEVEDQGHGIAEADQQHLFTAFYRVDDYKALRKEGLGLGLALTKRLIELQDGQIWVQSQLGVGTTFTFRLPQCHTRIREGLTSLVRPEHRV